MSTNAVTGLTYLQTLTSKTTSTTTNNKSTNDLSDFDSFMNILTTELENQDPLDPMSDMEFITQLSQIESLQQLNNIADIMDSSRAYSMLGKEVTYETTDSSGASTTQTGTVQAICINNGVTYLNVDGTQVDLSLIIQVNNADSTTTTKT